MSEMFFFTFLRILTHILLGLHSLGSAEANIGCYPRAVLSLVIIITDAYVVSVIQARVEAAAAASV